MAWTTPPTWTSGQVLTSSEMTIVSGDLTWLYGDSAWTTPGSFTNSWTNAGGVAYIRHGNLVKLRGTVTGGTGATSAFTLPVGYRPSVIALFVGVTPALGSAYVEITTAGLVVPQVAVALDCVTFSII